MGKTFFLESIKFDPIETTTLQWPLVYRLPSEPSQLPDGVPHPNFHPQADEQKLMDDSIKNTVMI